MMVEKILGSAEDFDLSALETDRVLFDHETLQKGHQRVKTESGRELRISLEHGAALFCGAVLYKDGKLAVVADMIPEDAIKISPRNNIEWAKAAFNIGNMHSFAYIYEDCMLIPYDETLLRLIEALDMPWERCMRKLDGMRAGVSVRGGRHSYSHSHNHGNSHSHGDNHSSGNSNSNGY